MKVLDKEKWKILIADDEQDVHDITKLVLHDFSYMDKSLHFISAFSAREVKVLIEEHPDVAVILLDAVMETDDAGLQLVNYIRKEKRMVGVRIVLRTGQAGHAPERYVIDNYDIDDYKNKSELTSQRLYTTIRSALKNYRDLRTIETTKQCLTKIIENSPRLYRIESEEETHRDILSMFHQLASGVSGNASPPWREESGFIVFWEEGGGETSFQGAGRFENVGERYREMLSDDVRRVLDLARKEGKNHFDEDHAIVVLKTLNEMAGLCFLEFTGRLPENGKKIMEIFSQQVVAAMETYALQGRLLHSEKMAAIGQMTGGLLHDVKNAMAGIHLSAQLIKDPNVSLEKKARICDMMETKFRWIEEIIADIFDFSRGGKNLRLKPLEVVEIMNPVMEWLRSDSMGNAVSINAEISFQGKVRVDDVKIKRCLMNLCKNALEAEMNAHQGKEPELTLAVEEREGRAFFSVTDNGCGIEKKYLKKIMDPFFTLGKKGGTGLGLAVVKQIIEGHGGKIRIDSQVGRGSTFTFDLEIVE